MRKIVLATKQVLTEGRPVANVSYQKSGLEVFVMVAHAGTTDSGEFRVTTWETVVALAPTVAELTFDRDEDILVYDFEGRQWHGCEPQ